MSTTEHGLPQPWRRNYLWTQQGLHRHWVHVTDNPELLKVEAWDGQAVTPNQIILRTPEGSQ